MRCGWCSWFSSTIYKFSCYCGATKFEKFHDHWLIPLTQKDNHIRCLYLKKINGNLLLNQIIYILNCLVVVLWKDEQTTLRSQYTKLKSKRNINNSVIVEKNKQHKKRRIQVSIKTFVQIGKGILERIRNVGIKQGTSCLVCLSRLKTSILQLSFKFHSMQTSVWPARHQLPGLSGLS